jgi:hypothetical protein
MALRSCVGALRRCAGRQAFATKAGDAAHTPPPLFAAPLFPALLDRGSWGAASALPPPSHGCALLRGHEARSARALSP